MRPASTGGSRRRQQALAIGILSSCAGCAFAHLPPSNRLRPPAGGDKASAGLGSGLRLRPIEHPAPDLSRPSARVPPSSTRNGAGTVPVSDVGNGPGSKTGTRFETGSGQVPRYASTSGAAFLAPSDLQNLVEIEFDAGGIFADAD